MIIKVWMVATISIILYSCGSTSSERFAPGDSSLKRRDLESYYLSNGLTSYFLPELPHWSNFSESARCRRDTSIKFINGAKVMSSLALNYEQVIQLQLMYNDELQKLRRQKHIDLVSLRDEEKLFYEVSQKIQQGLRTFRVPNFKRLNIIWVDAFPGKMLKKLMAGPAMNLGHPIFLSFCLSRQGMMEMLKKNKLANKNIRLISSELFSVYSSDKKQRNYFSLDLGQLIPQEKAIYFYTRKKRGVPSHLTGKYKIQYQ